MMTNPPFFSLDYSVETTGEGGASSAALGEKKLFDTREVWSSAADYKCSQS
jgi:hypothetical protein